MKLWRDVTEKWVYPPLEMEMVETGELEVEAYFFRLHNIIDQYIVNQPIIDMCLETESRPVLWVTLWWC